MSCDAFEAGGKVEALAEIPVQVNLGAPVDAANRHTVRPGDVGEITIVRRRGGLHWLVIRWERLGRTFNLNADQFALVKPIE